MFRWNKSKVDRLQTLYKEGLSLKIIRIDIGCQYTELSEKIKELGLERVVNKVRGGRKSC
jgi:hypothetical protein